MNSSFPLYDLLLEKYNKLVKEDSSKSDITVEEVREMIEGIHSLKDEKLEHVFVIIRIHSLKNENAKVFGVPYKGEKLNSSDTGGDIKFDVRCMPSELRRMLLEYVRMNCDIN